MQKSKRSNLYSKRVSSQLGDEQGPSDFSHQRPQSQADVSVPAKYQQNLLAVQSQLADSAQGQSQGSGTRMVVGGGKADQPVKGAGLTQNYNATGNRSNMGFLAHAEASELKRKNVNFRGQPQSQLKLNI